MLKETQAFLVGSLIADLQSREGEPLIKTLSEDIELKASAFTNPQYSLFYSAHQRCWARVVSNGRELLADDVIVELEHNGGNVDKWKELIATPRKQSSMKNIKVNANRLIDSEAERNVKGLFDKWEGEKHANIREGLVGFSNSILSLASGQGEESRPDLIMAESDAQGFASPASTGFKKLDYALSGNGIIEGGIYHKQGDLWIIGAPTGHGKSSFACNIVANLIKDGWQSIYITWEMKKTKLMNRLLCNLVDIPYSVAINSENGTDREKQKRADGIELLRHFLRLYERPQTIAEIGDVIRRHKVEFGSSMAVVIIDHLGVSQSTTGEQHWRHMESFSYDLKRLATREEVALICFSQVPGDVEAQLRESNKAVGADSRGSRGIRMAADVAMFLCKHNGKTTDGGIDLSKRDKSVLQLLKVREFGNEELIELSYNKERYRYSD